MQISNTIATATLNTPLDLEYLQEHLPGSVLQKTTGHWLKYRLQPENRYVAFYRSGKFLLTGKGVVEHSPSGGTVIIRSLRMQKEIRFQVEDRGVGIPPEIQKKLFSPFSGSGRTKRDGERSIGLGLIISRKIIEAHGGKMYVESKPGTGSTIGFTLPDSVLVQEKEE